MAARNSSVFPADPIQQAAVATPTSPVLAANPVHQAAAPAGIYGAPGALPTEQGSLTALPPPPQGAPAMKTVQRQGAYMAAPTPPQDPPVMKGGNTVVPMPLQEPAMTVPPRGGRVLAPLPFPARPPFPMVPPSFYDVAPPMMALQPPPAGYMMGQPLFPAGPPPLKRQRHDYFDMPFGPQMTSWEQAMAGFDESMGLPYGHHINNEIPSVGSYEPYLPSEASNTLHVEGLPSNCTRRELAHIFRPFTGFCAVRLVNGGYNGRHVIAYVDYETPAQAFSAMKSLQGYSFDMHDRYSLKLDLQFLPGSRSTDGSW